LANAPITSHPDNADHVEQGARGQHQRRAEPIGERAGERLPSPPQQHLDRQCQAELVAPPTVRGIHRREEETEGRTRAEADQADQTAAEQNDERRAPEGSLLR
jgi:hypothetical protein